MKEPQAAGAGLDLSDDRPKRKNVEGEGSYVKGAIVRVKLTNIQVCAEVEVFPGPGLNLVVGPNGAGKSTIVAGIFLCLGGDHRLLRRHEQLGDYVKSKPVQEKEGIIEVELCGGDGPNTVVKRRIQADRDKKEYWINGKPAKQSDIHKLCRTLNIHMENLCQFLPQDRVSEFADMNPQQILRATEEAVGGQEMLSLHDEIHKLGSTERDLDAKVVDKREMLSSKIKERDSLQKPYDRYQNRQSQKQTYELLVKKLAWAHYQEAYVKSKELAEVALQQKQLYEATRNALGPEQAEKTALEKKVKLLKDDVSAARKAMKDVGKKTDRLQDKFTAAEEEFETATDTKANAADRIASCQRKIQDAEDHVAEIDEAIARIPQVDMSKEIAAAKEAVTEATKAVTVAERAEKRIRFENDDLKKQAQSKASSLKQLESGTKQMENLIRNEDRDLYAAMTWLRENGDQFAMEVFEPIVMHLQVPDKSHAAVVEASIPKRDLLAFVTQCNEDNDAFFNAMKKQNLRVNIVQAPPPGDAPPHGVKNAAQLAKTVKFSTVADLIKAPDPIMRFLNSFHHLASICVLEDADGGHHADMLFEQHQVSRFFTAGQLCTVSRAKYGKKSLSKNFSPVKRARWLTQSVDQTLVDTMRSELGELKKQMDRNVSAHSEAKHKEAEARVVFTERHQALKKLQESQNELATMHKQRKRFVEKLANAQSRLKDEEVKAKSATLRVSQLAAQLITFALQKKRFILDIAQKAKAVFDAGLAHAQTERALRALDESFREKMAQARVYEVAYNNAKAEKRMATAHAKTLLEEAQKLIGGEQEPKNVPGLMDAFSQYTNNANELEALVAEEKAKLDCTADTDQDIVAQYEGVVEQINAIQVELDSAQQRLDEGKETLEKKKKEWMPMLKRITETVSEKFASMFANIGHVGEVTLHEDEHDYSQYGLEIRVSFKDDGKLHQLKGSFQSGGEKMVSTMVFLLALQKLTACPFRLVDEINQGMDQRNERRVFEQVVHCSEADGQAQYFMVSPKLLPDLKYSEAMKVIIIFSGPWLKADEWHTQEQRSLISKAMAIKRRRVLGPVNA
eukprot:m.26072 g.26072  ORF g.26072 m.26072 type:complete len:1078 (+) comp4290_c0_seq1:23-3256(+)